MIVLKILLSFIEDLAKTGITDIVVLDTLHQCRIWHMILADRRRLIQILSFTIKEFHELTKLTGLQSMLNKEDFNWIDQYMIAKLERSRKRLIELMFKIVQISLYSWNLLLFYLEWSKHNTEQFLVFIILASSKHNCWKCSFRTSRICI